MPGGSTTSGLDMRTYAYRQIVLEEVGCSVTLEPHVHGESPYAEGVSRIVEAVRKKIPRTGSIQSRISSTTAGSSEESDRHTDRGLRDVRGGTPSGRRWRRLATGQGVGACDDQSPLLRDQIRLCVPSSASTRRA